MIFLLDSLVGHMIVENECAFVLTACKEFPVSPYCVFLCYRHNLHHYMEFFKSIREALMSDSIDSLRKCMSEGKDAL
jgi:hypothetical protein